MDSARFERAITQRICVIDQTIVSETHRQYTLRGTTGNVYKVSISGDGCECSCPDSAKGEHTCKHILNVLYKVLKVDMFEIQNVLSSGVDENVAAYIFARAPRAVEALQTQHQDRSRTSSQVTRKPVEGECVICFETFKPRQQLTWCQTQCGYNFHKQCLRQWSDAASKLTCPCCRSVWQ